VSPQATPGLKPWQASRRVMPGRLGNVHGFSRNFVPLVPRPECLALGRGWRCRRPGNLEDGFAPVEMTMAGDRVVYVAQRGGEPKKTWKGMFAALESGLTEFEYAPTTYQVWSVPK